MLAGLLISLGSLAVSIYSVCQIKKIEKERKIKSVIIDEIADMHRSFLTYLTPIINAERKYSCQQTISWFKFNVCKLESINSFIIDNLQIKPNDIEEVKSIVQQLRSYITELNSFCKAYNCDYYVLDPAEIIEIEKLYALIYKSFLANIAKVNSAKKR